MQIETTLIPPLHLWEWPTSKQEMTGVGEAMEEKGLRYTADGNADWCNPFGRLS